MAKLKNLSEDSKDTTALQETAIPSSDQKHKEVTNTDRPLYVDEILKRYTNCQSLYIDSQGGTYTADTPQIIRGSATLYQNPYYKL